MMYIMLRKLVRFLKCNRTFYTTKPIDFNKLKRYYQSVILEHKNNHKHIHSALYSLNE